MAGSGQPKGGRLFRRILRGAAAAAAIAFGLVGYVYLTLPDVRVLATTNPTTTAFMKLREAEAAREGRELRHRHQWVRYSRISKNLQRAVLVAEDSRFFEHEGVETADQCTFLEAAGCKEMQGHYFSPAVPEEEIAALLTDERFSSAA